MLISQAYHDPVIQHKAFKYRIYPTLAQIEKLMLWEAALRYLWNLAHEQRLVGLAKPTGYKKYYTAFDQINQLTELRAELPWLADVPRNVCAQLLMQLDQAWTNCFKKITKRPKWKVKGKHTVNPCEPHPKIWRVEGNNLVFPKLGNIPIVMHRPLVGTPKSCTIVRDVDQWFVSIVTEQEVEEPAIKTTPVVGIDRGCVNLIADSYGNIFQNPEYLNRSLKLLAQAQQDLARKQKGSKNRKKAANRVAKLYRRIRRQRDQFLHVLSKMYAESQGVVVLEDLEVQRMIMNGTTSLSRRISDAAWQRFEMFLKYKLLAKGGGIAKVPAPYTSQTCSRCGCVDAGNRLSQSQFQCCSCGLRIHADTNAALNIRASFLAVEATVNVCRITTVTPQKHRSARSGQRSKGQSLSKAQSFRTG